MKWSNVPSMAGTWREFTGGTINASYLYSTMLKFSSAKPWECSVYWRLYHIVWYKNLQITETLNLIQSPRRKHLNFSILQGQNKLRLMFPSPLSRKWGILKDVRRNKPMLFINTSQFSAKELKMPILYFSIDSKPFNSLSWPQTSLFYYFYRTFSSLTFL